MTQILSQNQVNVIIEIVMMDIGSFYDADSEQESGKCYIRKRIVPSEILDTHGILIILDHVAELSCLYSSLLLMHSH